MDLRQFHAAFFEESREGLAAMESGLLALEAGHRDDEILNTIFRAAHSIKGGAGTFGFSSISAFTHGMETLLDEARSGKRALDAQAVEVLLPAVDVLGAMLDAAERGTPLDEAAVAACQARLEELLGGSSAVATAVEASAGQPWKVVFRPLPGLFLSGNDPLRILRELNEMGAYEVVCLTDALPKFAQLDPSQAYLGWEMRLPATVSRTALDDVFAWVEDQCTLVVETVGAEVELPVAASPLLSVEPSSQPRNEAENSIRVSVNKVDSLVNMVGELVITQAMLRQNAQNLDPIVFEGLLSSMAQLERNCRDLQESVMGIRMLPVEFAFSRFPRMVRDLATRLGKKVRLKTSGEQTELDKGVIEKIVDPLVHLIRNAIDHGLETPLERNEAGKEETGTIMLSARHQGGHIVIEVSDDGRGLNREKIIKKAAERGLPLADNPTDAQVWELIFHPGFSTADQLTDVSGRGVGMDVVKKNIQALGGHIDLQSRAGLGSTITIRLPLTLAILDGMTVSVGGEVFVVPLNVVVESIQAQESEIRTIAGRDKMLRLRQDYIPLLNLSEQYGMPVSHGHSPIAVVVESAGRRVALEVDELLGQQQVVIKNLQSNYKKISGVSGATILGDGKVALIVDAEDLIQHALLREDASVNAVSRSLQ